jgi:hypothetical protein
VVIARHELTVNAIAGTPVPMRSRFPGLPEPAAHPW